MNVSTIVVNWNSGAMLAELLRSAEQFSDDLISSFIMVDNGSVDSSGSFLESAARTHFDIKVVKNTFNAGFAFACNQGAALAKSDVLLFLNPDACLFQHSIAEPLAFLSRPENADVGIVGIRLVDDRGETTRSCARFPTASMFVLEALGLTRLKALGRRTMHMTDWAHDSTAQVDHVIGAFYMIRRSLFEQLGGFDERFFVYLEDLDLSLRARRAGWRIVYLASASAYHAGGGTSQNVKAQRLFYSLRSKLLYSYKHFRPASAWGVAAIVVLIEPLARCALAVARGRFQDLKHIGHAYWLLVCDLPTLLQRARNP